ncbi:MAG: hypothetical protein MJ207_00120 [Bacilli bacterium]|nr:hypothetical protein [Bacilli bacterium]
MAKKRITKLTAKSQQAARVEALTHLKMPSEHKFSNGLGILAEWIFNFAILAAGLVVGGFAFHYAKEEGFAPYNIWMTYIAGAASILAGLSLCIYTIFGHKRSHAFLYIPFYTITLLAIISIAADCYNVDVLGEKFVVGTICAVADAIVAVMVFGAAQRLTNKKLTGIYLLVALVVSVTIGILMTIYTLDTFASYTVGQKVIYYMLIWLNPLYVVGLILAYRSRIHYRNIVANQATANKLARQILKK